MEKKEIHNNHHFRLILLAAWILIQVTSSFGEDIAVGVAEAVPGSTVRVPILLADADGIASLRAQINYDPLFLEATGVTNNGAGDPVFVDFSASKGSFDLVLGTESNMPPGSRTAAYMEFRVNTGAKPGDYVPLILADHDLGEEHGASLAWSRSVTGSDGGVWIVYSSFSDQDMDGLSDYEEQLLDGSPDYNPGAGDSDVYNPDSDNDGIPDGWEVRNGLNPIISGSLEQDSDLDGFTDRQEWVADTLPMNNSSYPRIESVTWRENGDVVIQWPSSTGRLYNVARRSDLGVNHAFSNIAFSIRGSLTSTEFVDNTVTDNGPYFYRVSVYNDE